VDYQECGAVSLAFSDEEATELEARGSAQAAMGIPSKPVPLASVRQFWPRVRAEGLVSARFYPGDAAVDPRELTSALSEACRQAGVRILESSGLKNLQVRATDVRATFHDGEVEFDAAVIAAGAWSGSISIEGVPALPTTEPVKGQLIGYMQPLQTANTILRHGHSYAVQRGNGLLIVGASSDRVGFDRSIVPRVTTSLVEAAKLLLPHLAETAPSMMWTGFRPASDELHIGRWHSERLVLAYGHFRNGILLAPLTAKRVALLFN
jgi:glycine oxidase